MPRIPANRSGCLSCRILVASPPSSSTMFGVQPRGPRRLCSMHHSYSSSLSPFQAKTGTPRAAIAAAVWSWVEKMLHELQLSVVIGPFPACGAEHGSAATGRLDEEGIGKREELLTEGGEFGVDYG